MIHELRIYTLHHGTMGEYLDRYERIALPIQKRHLGPLVGFWVSDIGPMNQVLHIWQYQDLADRERRRAACAADPEWKAFLETNKGSFSQQECRILKPAPFMEREVGFR